MVSIEDCSLTMKIKQYTPLVKRLARQLLAKLPANVELDDLVQVGFIGLCEALERFDTSYGVKFETLATYRIRGAMFDLLRQDDWIGRSARQLQKTIAEATQALSHQLGRTPSEQELATYLQLPLQKFQDKKFSLQGIELLYLEDLIHPDNLDDESEERHQFDMYKDPATLLEEETKAQSLLAAIGTLPKRLQDVMEMYYESDMTLKEIATVLGVTESHVCLLRNQCIVRLPAKLNRWIDDRPISQYLEWYSKDMSDIITPDWQERV